MSLATQIEKLHRGELEFPAFARETRREWYRLAAWLLRRFPAPAGVDEEDVAQELLLAAWRFAARYDASRGVPAARYVQWNAIQKSKKFLDRQARRRDGGPPQIAVPLSSLGDDDERPHEVAVPPEQELRLAGVEDERAHQLRLDGLVDELGPRIGHARSRCVEALALAGGDIDAAAEAVYDNWVLALALGAGSIGAVKAKIRFAAREAAGLAEEGRA